MNKVRLPAGICGSWIWLKDHVRRDSFLLFRKEFNKDFSEEDVELWISANTAYQLFINARLVGFGPSGHSRADSCYIDQHSVGFFLEPGRNVIAVKAFYGTSCAGDHDDRPPGFWCQMSAGSTHILCSDETWQVMAADFFSGRRPVIAPGEGMTQAFQSENCPMNWASISLKADSLWKTPDLITPLEKFPLRPELFPMPPPAISPENPDFIPVGHGRISGFPNWTGVRFRSALSPYGRDTYAAIGYIFSETAASVGVRLFSDDQFKLFCGTALVAQAAFENGSCVRTFQISPGWNRLLLFQAPCASSMGFMMIFSGEGAEKIKVRQDMLDSAEEGWCVAGPLRLSMEEATPSLRTDRLRVDFCRCFINDVPCPEALIGSSVFQPSDDTPNCTVLRNGEYGIWKLPRVSYGFLKLSLDSGIGDVIDVAVGTTRTPCGFVGSNGRRTVGTLTGRGGRLTWVGFIPGDCLYTGIFIRSARGPVNVVSIEFKELSREIYREAAFRCSDDLLNRFWDTGYQTLRRSISMVPTADARISQDVFLVDAFLEAASASRLLGDNIYSASRLRQFLDSQLENGDIPAITHGRRRQPQLHHMLFLPRWIMHNYSFSESVVELERSLPALDFAREFFESMIDPVYGMLVFPGAWHNTSSRLSTLDFNSGKVSSCLNALFCRFLLSASDVYRISSNRKSDVVHCMRLAESIADEIRKRCRDPKTGLFYSWADDESSDKSFDCFTNFCTLYGGVMSPGDFENFFYEFFNYDPPFDKFGSLTPYSSILFTELLFACGQRRWVYRYMRDYWEKRLAGDSAGWLDRSGADICKTAFSNGEVISPNVFLIREILGIRKGENGQSTLFFHPGMDFVENAEGSVPMSNGRLLVRWRRTADNGLDVFLDANVPVTIMPELSAARLKKTSFELSEQVTLLRPPDDFEDDIVLP